MMRAVYYVINQKHPIVAGYEVGERVYLVYGGITTTRGLVSGTVMWSHILVRRLLG